MPQGDRTIYDFSNAGAQTQLAVPAQNARGRSATAYALEPNFCPECGVIISEQALSQHLIAVHDYLMLSGTLLPRQAALACLWERVFQTGDVQAHQRLCLLLGNRPDGTGRIPYVVALEGELARWLRDGPNQQRRDVDKLIRNLRQSETARPFYWELLTSEDARIRRIARELLLPDVAQALNREETSADEVRRWLDRLFPFEDFWEQIRICQRLPGFGAARTPVRDCLRRLQEERPVACPECGLSLPQYRLESHLRQSHRIYQFQGVTRSLNETITALLADVCRPRPEHETWETLEALVREEYGERADALLAVGVRTALQRLDHSTQEAALAGVAEVMAASGSGPRQAMHLAGYAERVPRQLALALTTRLPQPLGKALVRTIRPILARKRAPQEMQVAAAAALLATTGTDGPGALKVLNSLIARCGKARAVERLRLLERQVGVSQTLTELCTEIDNQIRMSCPRCRIQLRRPEMARHLWTEHDLVLDGRGVKKPWQLIRGWIKEYRKSGNAELLTRCRTLGQFLDPTAGLTRVHRLVLAYGVQDVEARQVLLAGARQRHASLCPRCYALVAVPDENMPRPLNESRGRLSLGGYCVEVAEGGLAPQLTMTTLDGFLYRGREPERRLSRHGITLLIAAPLVLSALVLAWLLRYWHIPAHGLVGLALFLALLAYLAACLISWLRARPVERALDYAWQLLVPRLHAGAFSVDDSTFLAGLALASVGRGQPVERAANLERVLRLTENAVAGAAAPLSHLAALKRLEVADRNALGLDPVPAVVSALARCFEGKVPLLFAEQLLADWEGSWWTAGNLARLRVLLCDKAFEAGLEVADLVAAGRAAPALGQVLQIDNLEGLAQLRLLWSLRPSRPWDSWSRAVMVFDLAADADSSRKLLGRYPDLLLVDEAAPPIYICGWGLVFQEILFTERPRRIEMKARREFQHKEYELLVGDHRFPMPGDASAVVHRLERWFRYHLSDFVPQVKNVYAWKAPAGTKPLPARQTVLCEDCQRLIIPVPGEVGVLVDPARKRRR